MASRRRQLWTKDLRRRLHFLVGYNVVGFRQQRENERHRTDLIQDHGASCVYSRTGLRDQEIRTNSLRSILQESLLGPSCLNTSRGTTSPVEAEFAHLSAGESYRERETTSFIHSGARRGWIKQRPRPAGKEGLRRCLRAASQDAGPAVSSRLRQEAP